MAQSDSSDLAGQNEPLIYADFVSQIRADQRAEGGVNQRFILPGKTN